MCREKVLAKLITRLADFEDILASPEAAAAALQSNSKDALERVFEEFTGSCGSRPGFAVPH
jgi:hypothetical protein